MPAKTFNLFYLPAAIMLTAGVYFACLPLYIQGGDTGELVAAARGLFVAHPPGYPLWIWLQSVWIRLIPVATEFWRASLLSCIFSLNAMLCLLWPVREQKIKLLCFAPLVALSPAFIEAAILPDVFSLHALFTVLVGTTYLYGSSRQRAMYLPFLFLLSAANHHTTVFLAPLLIADFTFLSKTERKIYFASLAAGATATTGLYLSLFVMHPDSPYSWGSIETLRDLVGHVLRSDYGTFRLQAGNAPPVGLSALKDFSHTSLFPVLGMLLACVFVGIRGRVYNDRRFLIFAGTALLSAGFFFFSNITPVGIGQEVLLRFHLMPLLLAIMACIYAVQNQTFTPAFRWVAVAAAVVPSVYLLGHLNRYLNLRSDSVIEDYAANLLREAQLRQPSIILTDTDSAYFAIRSLQSLSGSGTAVTAATKTLFFYPWFQAKTRELVPQFQIPRGPEIAEARKLNLKEDLISPNASAITWLVTSGFQDGKDYGVTFLGLGRTLKAGQGVDADHQSLTELSIRTYYMDPPKGPQAFTRGLLFSQYSHFYLMTKQWRAALKIVPFAYPAVAGLCAQDGTDLRCQEDAKDRIQKKSAPYF